MSKILEMMEKRNQEWEGAKAFVESKKDKDGLLTKEDAKTYDEMVAKVQNFSMEIDRLQKEQAMEEELSKLVNSAIVAKPMAAKDEKPKKTGRASNEYKEAILSAFRNNFKRTADILQEGVDADGGYLVPEEYDNRLIQTLDSENIMRKLATKITTTGQHKINIAASDPEAAWIEEGGALNFGDSKFAQVLLDAHKLHVAIKVTEELLYDNAFKLEDYILTSFGKALANAEEDAFLNGDGTGKPTGIFAKTGGGTYLKEVTAIKSDDLIDLIHALKRPYRKNAAFIMNDKTIAQVRVS